MENTQTTTTPPTAPTTSDDNSLESSMMEMFNAATETVPQETQPQADAATTEAPEAKTDDRARDGSGKFVKKDEAATEQPATEQSAQQKATEQPAVEQPAATTELRAPSSWSATAKSEFAKLNPVVQKEVAKREEDFHKGIEQYKESANFANNMRQVIRPFEQTLRQLNATPEQAVHELLKAEHLMRTLPPEQKTAYFYQLANQYGVQLQPQQQSEQQHVDPTVQALQQQVGQLTTHINQVQQREQQYAAQQKRAADQQAQTELQTFAKDPKSMYLENVREDMALLLQEGRATDLQDAYDKACWQNPEIRQILLQQQIQASGNKRIEEAKQKAANAKRAGFDVVGQGSVAAGDRAMSLEEELMSRYTSTSN